MKLLNTFVFTTCFAAASLSNACDLTSDATAIGKQLETDSHDTIMHEFIWWLAQTMGPNIPTEESLNPSKCESGENNLHIESHTYPHVDGLVLEVIGDSQILEDFNQRAARSGLSGSSISINGQQYFAHGSRSFVYQKVTWTFETCFAGDVYEMFLFDLLGQTVVAVDRTMLACDESYTASDDLWQFLEETDTGANIHLRDGGIVSL